MLNIKKDKTFIFVYLVDLFLSLIKLLSKITKIALHKWNTLN